MKQFFNVLGFELSGYFKNKAYSITTIILSLFLIVGLSLPSLFDMSNIIPSLQNDTNVESLDEVSGEDKTKFVIVDNNNFLGDLDVLETAFPNSKWTKVESSDEAKKMVKSEKAEAAFILNSLNKYSYVVDNLGLHDTNQMMFESLLANLNQQFYATKYNLEQSIGPKSPSSWLPTEPLRRSRFPEASAPFRRSSAATQGTTP